MKFSEFLLEVESLPDYDEIIKTIASDCAPFMREIGEKPLFRGIKVDGVIQTKKVRTTRRPLDTKRDTSEAFDLALAPYTGFKTRSEGVFTTSRESDASIYGNVHFFFPKGEYQYAYSTYIDDLSQILEAGALDRGANENIFLVSFTKHYKDMVAEGLIKPEYSASTSGILIPWYALKGVNKDTKYELFSRIFKEHKIYSTDNLDVGIESEVEIIFKCEEYYAVLASAIAFKYNKTATEFLEDIKRELQ